MDKKIVGIIVLLLGFCGVVAFYQFWSESSESEGAAFGDEVVEVAPGVRVDRKLPKAEVPAPVESGGPVSEAGFLPTSMESPQRFEALKAGFADLGKCLNMELGSFNAQEEINTQAVLRILSPDLGSLIMTAEEWAVTDLRTPQGELRRILIDYVTDNNLPDPVKTLKYYSVSGGQLKELPISAELAQNPSETLIASLESDGQTVATARSQRFFFENGDNVLTVEKNGRIDSIQLSHDGKTAKCTGLGSQMQCQCRRDVPQ